MSRSKGKSKQAAGLRSANTQPVVITQIGGSPKAFMPEVQTFPNVTRTRMRYAWTGSLATQAGANTTQVFRLNSLYDPDQTGAGAQPKYFDTLCAASGGTAPYQYYRVKKTHFRVMFTNPSSSSSTASYAFCQVYSTNALGASSTIADLFETVNCSCAQLAPAGNGPFSVASLEGRVDHAKLWGVKDFDDNEDFVGVYNGNPAMVSYLMVGVRSADDTTVATMRVVVQLVFEVEFYSLNNAGLSAIRSALDAVSSEALQVAKVSEQPKPVVGLKQVTGVVCACNRNGCG